MGIRIGISGWTYAPWRGTFYPKGLPQRSELGYVAERMNSLEINGSFYALQRRTSFEAWAAAVPPDFVFAVKGGRFITHLKKLTDVAVPLANFYASGVLALGNRLGPFLWQLPPNLGYDPARMTAFFEQLPRTAGAAATLAAGHDARIPEDRALLVAPDPALRLRHTVEVRHETFRDRGFYDLLREHDIGLVLADNPGKWPIIEEVTTDFTYVRLHGHEELYASGYSDEALDAWAARVLGWAERGQDVYVYCDNDVKVRAPYDAIGLLDRVQGESVAAPERILGMATRPQAVLFDADGVLQRMVVEWRDELGDRSGAEGPAQDRLLDAIAHAEKPTMTGEVDLAHSLSQVLEDHDADLEVDEILEAWQDIEVDEAVLDGVRALRGRGMILALTTNQSERRGAWMRANLPYDELFDAHFYSCELGLAKPDPAYFTRVLDTLGVAAGDALFLDDTAVNVESAARLGLRAELFARNGGRAELDRILALHGLAVEAA